MNRWETQAIEYTDIASLKSALVGRSIVSTLSEGDAYDRVLSFVLDDGTILKAHATDGGCACSNGCFTVENPESANGTILNVELRETVDGSDVEPGSILEGSATIRVYVYDELGKHTLIESEGGDNGYYGWGFWLSVQDVQEASA